MPAVPAAWHDNAIALWHDAVAKSKAVKAAWPYNWVEGVDYPHKDGARHRHRPTRPQRPAGRQQEAAPSERRPCPPRLHGQRQRLPARAGNGNIVTWPHDGDYYQFWTDGAEDGKFTIPNVRPGTYTLHAFADGVLGEYAKANITVEAGKTVDLGKLDWQPVRYGKQIWEIGYPDRTGDKFFKGDGANYWLWGWPLRYARPLPQRHHLHHRQERLPQGLVLRGGAALRPTTAWMNPAAKDPSTSASAGSTIPPTEHRRPVARVGPGQGHHLDHQVQHAQSLERHSRPARGPGRRRRRRRTEPAAASPIGVNGQTVGTIHPVATNALRYNTNKGVWYQYIQKFDAVAAEAGRELR